MKPSRSFSKSVSVLWLNLKEGRIYQVSEERMGREIVRSAADGAKPLFARICERLREASGPILLLGAMAQERVFHDYLKAHFPEIAERVIGCDPLEVPADHEIAARIHFAISGRSG